MQLKDTGPPFSVKYIIVTCFPSVQTSQNNNEPTFSIHKFQIFADTIVKQLNIKACLKTKEILKGIHPDSKIRIVICDLSH